LAVYLPDQDVVITGDLIGTGDPLIRRGKNGICEGWAHFASAQLDADTYVLGHADPQTKAQVEANLKKAQDKRAKIAALVTQGKSPGAVKQALGQTSKPANAPPFPSPNRRMKK
jgi:glyoxylase-like metal-dependent hydrolase (beta-lactamase superfamily II)